MATILRLARAMPWTRTLLVLAAVAGCADPTDDEDLGLDPDAALGEAGDPTPDPLDATSRIDVSTVAELEAALAAATPGQVIYVADTATLDLTGKQNLIVPARVTIASGRGHGGSAGALLRTKQLATSPLFRAGGEGVRFTGLRILGPDTAIGSSPYGTPLATGILAPSADDLQVDHCELSGWSYAAISLDRARRAYVHHNSIHHNRRTGLGYGIVLVHAADALVERNTFDANRHAIAATGRPDISYEARYNLVGPTRNGHAFDMHGENEAADNGSPYAGDTIRIHHNTFRGTPAAVIIRGRPKTGAYISDNCFATARATAVLQRYFTGNFFVGTNRYSTSTATCHTGAAAGRSVRGDVNGDGLADLVTLAGGSAHTFLGSRTSALTAMAPVFGGTMKSALEDGLGHLAIDVADVDNDGFADLVTASSDGNVHVSAGAAARRPVASRGPGSGTRS